MGVFRLLLVVMVTLSASVSGAMDAGHMPVMSHSHSHASVDEVADTQLVCCSESSDRSQTCHGLPALVPGTELHDAAPVICDVVSIDTGELLTGFEPSGPLDPPRAV